MKGFALVLLCVVAIAQGRSAGVQSSSTALAALGENPWLVHLRIAVSTSGFLNSCAGSLIGERWALTSGGCVDNARFIWIRYGVVNVVNPELVTETSAVRVNPDNDVALVSINRAVESSANISPVRLATADSVAPESARFCSFGAREDGSAGERLSCFSVVLEESDSRISAKSDDGEATRFDLGAPLVSDGVQIGILVEAEGAGIFVKPSNYAAWIQEVTGISASTDQVRVVN